MRILVRIALCALAAGWLVPAPSRAQTHPGRVGVGISLSERGIGTFTDIAKEVWAYQPLAGGRDLGPSEIDANGWPTVDCQKIVMDVRPAPEWAGAIDDPQAYRVNMSGTYKGALTGQATVRVNFGTGGTIVQNVLYNASTNQTTFDLIIPGPPGPGHGLAALGFVNTRRTPASPLGSGFTNLRIMKPGYALGSSDLLHQAFLDGVASADFAALRFMDFTGTNYQERNFTYPRQREWATRKLPTDASQAAFPGKDGGAAWEHVIEIANETGIDPWINVPVSASPDYIAQLATLLKNELDPALNVYVESSNEVWNSIFPQYAYNAAEASARGLSIHLNHARRTVQISQIFASVFGTAAINSRVRVVLASHAPMLEWWVQPMLNDISNNFGPPRDYLFMLARQGYFLPASIGATDSVATLLNNARANIDSQVAPDSINHASRQEWVAKALSYGLPGGCAMYEGGPHFPADGGTTNLANQITASRDPVMGDLLRYNYGPMWADLGGSLAMHYNLTGAYNRFGCWGLTDDVTKPDRNYKFAAIRSMVGPVSSTPAPVVGAPSNLTATALSTTQIRVSWVDNATNEIGFHVERAAAASGPWKVVAVVGTNNQGHTDSGLTAGTTYYYRVRAGTNTVWSAYSNTASATTMTTSPPPPPPPAPVVGAPSNLTATALSTTQIRVSWVDNATNEIGFHVERAAAASGPWKVVAVVGTNNQGHTDSGLTAGTTYYYRVRAGTNTVWSAYSNTASATTKP